MASAKLERMFRVTELDHPERATYRWTKLERPSSRMSAAPHAPELANDAQRGTHCVQRVVQGHLVATLYLGDCRDIAPQLEGVDAVISDPPYGMDWNTNYSRFRPGVNGHGGRILPDRPKIQGDAEPFDPAAWLEYPAVVLFGCNHYAQRLPVGTTLVWLKRHDAGFGSFLSDAELAWMKGGHGVYAKRDLSMNAETLTRCHPTQKPVPLMAWCMEMAKVPAGATVLDPYMGSGTTGIACLRTGRNFVGIEKDPAHFANAVARLEREANQGALL